MEVFDYIKKRQSRIEGDRGTWEDHWQQILDYVMPRKADSYIYTYTGEKRTEVLFDSTAITANNLLAASLQGTLNITIITLVSIKLRDDDLNEDREVQLWLEDTARRMYDMFNENNFNTEVHEMYLDLCSIGTAALFVEEGREDLIQMVFILIVYILQNIIFKKALQEK